MSKPDASRDRVLKALKKHGPISIPDLAKKVRMLPATVNSHINSLHAAQVVHVKEYSKERGRTHMRIWAIGSGEDANRGPKFDCRAYYFGADSDDSPVSIAMDNRRRQELLARVVPFRDPMLFLTAGRPA